MNVTRLRRVAAAILKYPEHYDQCTWGRDPKDRSAFTYGNALSAERLQAACLTQACIGGWAVALNPKTACRLANVSHASLIKRHELKWLAQKILGLKGDQDDLLASEWTAYGTRQFQCRYETARTPDGQASAGAARIEYLIKTGR